MNFTTRIVLPVVLALSTSTLWAMPPTAQNGQTQGTKFVFGGFKSTPGANGGGIRPSGTGQNIEGRSAGNPFVSLLKPKPSATTPTNQGYILTGTSH